MPGAHFSRGPSGAHRWRKCPGSIREERGLPDTAGIEAALGTVFHEYAAVCLETGLDPFVFIGAECDTGSKFGVLKFDREMANNMLAGLDYVRDIAAQPGVLLFVEVSVDISPWVGHDEDGNPGFGTSDVILVDVAGRRIIIFDWKYGAGVPISPIENDQAILYGLGAWESIAGALFDWDPEGVEVELVIEQPRAPGGGGNWPTDMAYMLREGDRIRMDSVATEDPDAPCVPGAKQCGFCKAAHHNTCVTRKDWMLAVFDTSDDEIEEYREIGADLPLPKPKAMSPEHRSYVLQNRPMIEKWFEDLHAEAYDDAMKGRPCPDMKLVYGRAPAREWRDHKAETLLKNRFGEQAYQPKKLRSPAMIEEEMGKKAFKESPLSRHVFQGDPKPILVPESDKRDPVPDLQDRLNAGMEDSLV